MRVPHVEVEKSVVEADVYCGRCTNIVGADDFLLNLKTMLSMLDIYCSFEVEQLYF